MIIQEATEKNQQGDLRESDGCGKSKETTDR
jgi:hypothetical protein